MTFRDFLAVVAADPEVLELAVLVLVWLPVVGGLMGVLLAHIVVELFAWVIRAFERQPPHAKRDYTISDQRSAFSETRPAVVHRWPDGTPID